MKFRTISYALVAIAILITFSFVSQSAGVTTAQSTAQATAQVTVDVTTSALLRVINASPDATAIDIYLDKAATPVISNLAYSYGTDGYKIVTAGAHHITLTAAGDTTTVIYDDDVTVPAGTANTLLLQGLGSDKSRIVRFLQDDVSDTAGQSRIKVSNSIVGGSSLDVVSGDLKTTYATDIPYGSTAIFSVAPGTYDILLVPHGSTDPKSALITGTGIKLVADQIYTLLAIGTAKDASSIKPLLFVTSPVAGFQPPVFGTPVATPAQ
jgi:hypothetical protein